MTEVVARARRATAEHDFGVLMRLIDEQVLFLWYGVPLQELRTMLLSIPEPLLRVDPAAFLVVRAFFSLDPDSELEDPALAAAAAEDPVVQRWVTFATAWRARMRGDLIASSRALRSMPEVAGPIPLRVDRTGGVRSLFVTQAMVRASFTEVIKEVICRAESTRPPKVSISKIR
jgi:hypothetical protein